MKFLFVHQNMPGQYRELVQWLGASGTHDIVFLTQRQSPPTFKGVREVIYKPHNRAKDDAYGLVKTWENAAGSGFGAAMAAKTPARWRLDAGHYHRPHRLGGIDLYQRDLPRRAGHRLF